MKRLVVILVLFVSTAVLAMGQAPRGMLFKKCRPIADAPLKVVCDQDFSDAIASEKTEVVPSDTKVGVTETQKRKDAGKKADDVKDGPTVGRLIDFNTGEPVEEVSVKIVTKEGETSVRITGLGNASVRHADKDVSCGFIGGGASEFHVNVQHTGKKSVVTVLSVSAQKYKELGTVAVLRGKSKDVDHIAVVIPETLTYRVERTVPLPPRK